MSNPKPLSDTGRPIFRASQASSASTDQAEGGQDTAESFRARIDNFPVVASKNAERLGGESKSDEEGEEG